MMKKDEVGIGRLYGATKEANSQFKRDKNQRAEASNTLEPTALGDNQLANELTTTLGGVSRPLTNADLFEFRRRVGLVRRRSTNHSIKHGITAQQVIAFAKPSPNIIGARQKQGKTDIDRANKQIKMAVLTTANKGLLKFVTNASGETKGVTRHHVNVRLMTYPEAVALPRESSKTRRLGKWLANQPLKFECDCGRHTYWFRYVASIGGWCEGREETGYPKVRNPQLMGVACKHVLRVMRELTTGNIVHDKIGRMVATQQPIRTKQKDADRQAKNQSKKPKLIDNNAARKAIKGLKKEVAKYVKSKDDERRASKGDYLAREESIRRIKRMVAERQILKECADKVIEQLEKEYVE